MRVKLNDQVRPLLESLWCNQKIKSYKKKIRISKIRRSGTDHFIPKEKKRKKKKEKRKREQEMSINEKLRGEQKIIKAPHTSLGFTFLRIKSGEF